MKPALFIILKIQHCPCEKEVQEADVFSLVIIGAMFLTFAALGIAGIIRFSRDD